MALPSEWKAMMASPRYREVWKKAVALALPKNRDRCPKCGARDFLRSRRKNFLEFTISKFVLPYRCPHCYLRFFRPVEAADAGDPKRFQAQYDGMPQARRV